MVREKGYLHSLFKSIRVKKVNAPKEERENLNNINIFRRQNGEWVWAEWKIAVDVNYHKITVDSMDYRKK